MGEARVRRLPILAVAALLAAANPAAPPARAQANLSPESMEAARALFSVLFDHAFEVAAFYRTPTGAKMLGILPRILPDAFATILPRVQAMNTETQDLFLKLLRERGLLN
jgi:hypothetical protein